MFADTKFINKDVLIWLMKDVLFKSMMAALIVAMMVAGAAMAQSTVSVSVTVIGPNNTAAANAVVQAWQSNSVVAQGTTSSSGTVTLNIPNATTTFWVSLGNGEYILETVTTITSSITLNASSYYPATLATNTTYSIPVTITDNNNSITAYTNATVYSTDSGVTITYPNQTTVNLFTVLKFVNMTVNGTPQTGNSVTVSFTGPLTIIGYYAVSTMTLLGIPLNTTTLIIIIAIVAVLLGIMVMYAHKSSAKKMARARSTTWV